MPDYRLYFIGVDGSFKKAVPLNCKDDEAAKASARELLPDGCKGELWHRARPIAAFDQMTAHNEKSLGCADNIDLNAKATLALDAARALPRGPERIEALKRAGLLRTAADAQGLTFANRGRPRN